MDLIHEGLSSWLSIEMLTATRTMSWPCTGTTTTSSMLPDECAFTRWVSAYTATTATTITTQIATTPTGGSDLRAVPYSSAISKPVDCSWSAGGRGGGVTDGSAMITSLRCRLYSHRLGLRPLV